MPWLVLFTDVGDDMAEDNPTLDGKPYREGDEPDPQPAEGTPRPGEWFGASAKGDEPLPPPDPENDPSRERPDAVDPRKAYIPEGDTEGDRFVTAVLLVLTERGVVVLITNLANMELHHLATPHEVFRLCADVKDQISSVRTIGEVLRNTAQIMDMTFQKYAGPAPQRPEPNQKPPQDQ